MIVRLLDFGAEAADLRALRKRVLYPRLPEAKALYPGDEDAVHIGALNDSGTLRGVASLFAHTDGSLQLRGMATEAVVRGEGYGVEIVRFAEIYAIDTGVSRLWCNARLAAVGFYERCGWQTEGEEFDILDIGPHYRMISALRPDDY